MIFCDFPHKNRNHAITKRYIKLFNILKPSLQKYLANSQSKFQIQSYKLRLFYIIEGQLHTKAITLLLEEMIILVTNEEAFIILIPYTENCAQSFLSFNRMFLSQINALFGHRK